MTSFNSNSDVHSSDGFEIVKHLHKIQTTLDALLQYITKPMQVNFCIFFLRFPTVFILHALKKWGLFIGTLAVTIAFADAFALWQYRFTVR